MVEPPRSCAHQPSPKEFVSPHRLPPKPGQAEPYLGLGSGVLVPQSGARPGQRAMSRTTRVMWSWESSRVNARNGTRARTPTAMVVWPSKEPA